MRIEVGEDALTSFHVRCVVGEKFDSVGARSSPIRNEPKKPVVHADQITCFCRGSHFDEAMREPSVSRTGSVTTRLLLCLGLFWEVRFPEPFMRRGRSVSSVMWDDWKP